MQDQINSTITALINRGVDSTKAIKDPKKTFELYLTLIIEKATPLLTVKDLEDFELKDTDTTDQKIEKFKKLTELALPMAEKFTHDEVTEIINELNQNL